MTDAPVSWYGYPLRWIDDDRSGRPLTDWSSGGHILNPYYYSDGLVWCACRDCEPHMWVRYPLEWWLDDCPSDALERAANRFAGVDLIVEYRRHTAPFTPLWYYGGKFPLEPDNAHNDRNVKEQTAWMDATPCPVPPC